jgi:hypothetical protein
MITTPGEMYVGMVFTVLEGKPLVDQKTFQEREVENLVVTIFGGEKPQASLVPGLGRPYVVRAIQLPMILAQHLTDQKPVVFDSRTLVFRELSKDYVREYLKMFSVCSANQNKRASKTE